MSGIFLKIAGMSVSASWLIAAAVVIRLVLKKAPKWISVLLWGIVAIRLICPFSIESTFSLIPSTETITAASEMAADPVLVKDDRGVNGGVNSAEWQPDSAADEDSINRYQIEVEISAYVWMAGASAMLIYAGVSLWRLHRRVDTAVLLRDNIYQSENVSSPFVLGTVRPKIYLPFEIDKRDIEYVIAHEQAHIRRKDHWWKLLGFLALTLHWFNPLVWLGYVLMSRDVELACDESVVGKLGNEQRADYSTALVNCSVNHRILTVCPLAFGEVGVRERVKAVMNYKKPTFWVTVAAVLMCVTVAVCFLTNPADKGDILTLPVMQPALEDIREGYSVEQAAADGCVVFDEDELLAGREIWRNFVDVTGEGKADGIRVYQTYTNADESYYVVQELSFDGEKYHLKFYDIVGDTGEEFLFEKEYRYLVYSRLIFQYGNSDNYLLSDSRDVTANGYYEHLLSSTYSPESKYNACFMIYSESRE